MTLFPYVYLFLAQGRIVGLWALLILERTLVHGRDLLVRLYFRAIYYLGGMVLAFASLFYDFVVDCILHSSLFIILKQTRYYTPQSLLFPPFLLSDYE